MVVTSAYSSSLISYLTISFGARPIQSILELMQSGLTIYGYGNDAVLLFGGSHYEGLSGQYKTITDLRVVDKSVLKGKASLMDSQVALDHRIRLKFTDRYSG